MFKNIQIWCNYHLNKSFLRLLKVCLKSYPYDYDFLYQIEEAKIKEMLDYHKNSKVPVVDDERNQIIKTLKLALSMLHIIRNETDYYHFDGELEFEDVDDNNGKLHTINTDNLKYHCDVYINIKNKNRFNISDNVIKLHPHSLYVEKARQLYFKIRSQYEQTWWD